MFLRARGFTLIEVLITSFIATCGLVAVASMFSFATRANVSNRQTAVATALLYGKMEELKSTPLDSAFWNTADGSDAISQETTFTRVWHIGPTVPRLVTVVVYGETPLTHRQVELIRATTIIGNTF